MSNKADCYKDPFEEDPDCANDPLNLLSDLQDKSQYIETVQVYPRVIQDGPEGGSMSMVLPKKKAYLSADSRLILPLTCTDPGFQLVPSAGINGIIESATMRTETGGVIAQSQHSGELYVMINHTVPPERRSKVDSVHHGISFAWEGASGSKMNANASDREVLPGQLRLKSDNYMLLSPADVVGRNNCKPNCVSAKNDLLLTTTFENTPEFSITLGRLFPGLFRNHFQLPLALFAEEIIIDVNFSQNGDFGQNDRCVCAPTLLSDNITPSCITTLGIYTLGECPADLQEETNYIMTPFEKPASGGDGLRIMVDFTEDGAPSNIRILDAGLGYAAEDKIVFGDPAEWPESMVLMPGHNFKDNTWDDDVNFLVVSGGADFVQDQTYKVVNPSNPDLNFNITATDVDAGALVKCTLDKPETNDNLSLPNGTPEPLKVLKADGKTDSGATLVVASHIYTITTSNGTNNFGPGAGLFVEGDADEKIIAYVSEVDGNDNPTELYVVDISTFEAGITLEEEGSEGANTFEVATLVGDPVEYTSTTGLGHDPVWSFNTVDTGRVNLVTGKVSLATDLVFYLNGKTERDLEVMLRDGYQIGYTQYIDVLTTLSKEDDITSYGEKVSEEFSRQIGFSNEVLRNLMFAVSPSGTQNKKQFPYYGKTKLNPLLNKYCSMGSLAMNGIQFQVNVNSVPYYSQAIQTDLRMLSELNKCHGVFYIPKPVYSAWPACRQLDNSSDVNDNDPTLQPGFTTLDDWKDDKFKSTLKYEINERKMGVANQLWHGIPQKWALGQGHYNGCSFMFKDDPSIPGNGAIVGNNAVDIRYTHDSTFNPYYGGTARMMLFGEVERVLSIKDGIINVTTAAF